MACDCEYLCCEPPPALAWIGMVGMVGLRRGGPGYLDRSRLEKGLPRFYAGELVNPVIIVVFGRLHVDCKGALRLVCHFKK